MHDTAYFNRMHQVTSVVQQYGERGVTSAELLKDIRVNGINPGTVRAHLIAAAKDGYLRRENTKPNSGRAVYRYFSGNGSARDMYQPLVRTGGDRSLDLCKVVTDVKVSNGGMTLYRTGEDGKTEGFPCYFSDPDSAFEFASFILSHLNDFTPPEGGGAAAPISPIGTDSSFWMSDFTTDSIGSVTPPKSRRRSFYPDLKGRGGK